MISSILVSSFSFIVILLSLHKTVLLGHLPSLIVLILIDLPGVHQMLDDSIWVIQIVWYVKTVLPEHTQRIRPKLLQQIGRIQMLRCAWEMMKIGMGRSVYFYSCRQRKKQISKGVVHLYNI